jgi:hypothetical protein
MLALINPAALPALRIAANDLSRFNQEISNFLKCSREEA